MLTDGNFLIVDKTAKIAELVAWPLVFFARPRRMGKSTLCSMLEELFAHGTSRFAGKKMALLRVWWLPQLGDRNGLPSRSPLQWY